MYDLIIIGAGPAGLSAAIHAVRYGLKFALLEKDHPGGQARVANRIYNYPGFIGGISGRELMDAFIRQVKAAGATIVKNEVKKISSSKNGFIVDTSAGEYRSRTVIVATGLAPKKLPMEGGYYYPDPATIRHEGKTVLVIGGGDCAFDQAIAFSKFAKKVTIAMRSDEPSCTRGLYDEARAKNIEILTKIDPNEAKNVKKPEVLVINIGKTPDFSVFKGFSDENLPKGLFLTGDILHPSVRHVVVAAGDGVKAVEEVRKCLSMP